MRGFPASGIIHVASRQGWNGWDGQGPYKHADISIQLPGRVFVFVRACAFSDLGVECCRSGIGGEVARCGRRDGWCVCVSGVWVPGGSVGCRWPLGRTTLECIGAISRIGVCGGFVQIALFKVGGSDLGVGGVVGVGAIPIPFRSGRSAPHSSAWLDATRPVLAVGTMITHLLHTPHTKSSQIANGPGDLYLQ
ncbi:hypothetical protein K439DRAFT_1614263 [Ramaria rubella]|nr:hypothetical protein K439DRAFT_1614263 [Ramaria rubella]